MIIVWTETSLTTLENIRDHITGDAGGEPAQRLIARFFAKDSQLTAFPRSGRMVPEAQRPEVRELFVDSYRLVYRVDAIDAPSRVDILGAVHTSRLLENTPVWSELHT